MKGNTKTPPALRGTLVGRRTEWQPGSKLKSQLNHLAAFVAIIDNKAFSHSSCFYCGMGWQCNVLR